MSKPRKPPDIPLEALENLVEIAIGLRKQIGEEESDQMLELVRILEKHKAWPQEEIDRVRYNAVLDGRELGKTWLQSYAYASKLLRGTRARGQPGAMAWSYKRYKRGVHGKRNRLG
jgi:hypothetical protein